MADGPKKTILPAAAVRDPRLGHAAFRLLAALGIYADKAGRCCPSHATIGRDLGWSRQAVQRQVRELEAAGYLEVTARHRNDGSATSNDYLLKAAPCNAMLPPPCNETLPPPATSEPPPRQHHVGHPANTMLAPKKNDPMNDPMNVIPLPGVMPAMTIDEQFDRFWQHYPRKVSKADARKAFPAALKVAAAETIVEGARRYAAKVQRLGTETRFVKHPGGWLRDRRWEDELGDDTAPAVAPDPDDAFKGHRTDSW